MRRGSRSLPLGAARRACRRSRWPRCDSPSARGGAAPPPRGRLARARARRRSGRGRRRSGAAAGFADVAVERDLAGLPRVLVARRGEEAHADDPAGADPADGRAGFRRAFARLRAVRRPTRRASIGGARHRRGRAPPRRPRRARLYARFDGARLIAAACASIRAELRAAADVAAASRARRPAIWRRAASRAFHARQRQASWRYRDAVGLRLGQQITPLRRVGVYVPGGHAAYPSSVLMNVLPARVAGVREIIMVVAGAGATGQSPRCSPPPTSPGSTAVYRIGGAQAVAALAYGTRHRAARRQDRRPRQRLRAGREAAWSTAGRHRLDRRAERGAGHCRRQRRPGATSPPICSRRPSTAAATSAPCCSRRRGAWRAAGPGGDRRAARGAAAPRRHRARPAPPRRAGRRAQPRRGGRARRAGGARAPRADGARSAALAPRLRNAGALFLGPYAPAPLGDYLAGPNHVLPTGGSARFFSPLGVYDFVKRTSVVVARRRRAAAPGAGDRDAGRAGGLRGACRGDPRALRSRADRRMARSRDERAASRRRPTPRERASERPIVTPDERSTAAALPRGADLAARDRPATTEPRTARASARADQRHEGDRHPRRRSHVDGTRRGRGRHRRAVPRPHARQLRAARLLRPRACGRAATSTSTSTTPSRTSAWRSARRCARRSATRRASAASARRRVRSTRRWSASSST